MVGTRKSSQAILQQHLALYRNELPCVIYAIPGLHKFPIIIAAHN